MKKYSYKKIRLADKSVKRIHLLQAECLGVFKANYFKCLYIHKTHKFVVCMYALGV